MSQHQGHGVDGLKSSQVALAALFLSKCHHLIRYGIFREEEKWIGVPGMGF
jgi:hypothetical protein